MFKLKINRFSFDIKDIFENVNIDLKCGCYTLNGPNRIGKNYGFKYNIGHL